MLSDHLWRAGWQGRRCCDWICARRVWLVVVLVMLRGAEDLFRAFGQVRIGSK
jgi:hypothetical protein